jgi:TolB-like protein/DNA-binding winged helix-turn-helix (wHTH) protein/Tfp pilus assembly protein PilF
VQILMALLERPGQEVSREELRDRLWPPGVFVDFENGLNAAINRLREALGDSADNPRYVETRPRHGYRFVAPVEELPSESALRPESTPSRRRRAVVAIVLAAVLLMGTGVLAWRLRVPGGTVRAIVVLPLANLSGNPAEDYFVDGITEELTTQLAKIGTLRVISRTSAAHYRGSDKPLPTIARELGVDAVLEGSVVRTGGRVRVTAQLIDAARDAHLWAETFERDASDVLRLQEDLARSIVAEIAVHLTPEEQRRFRRARHVDPAAHEAYLKGRYFWNKRTAEGFKAAVEAFQLSLARDPTFAPAFAGLADTYGLMASSSYDVLPASEAMPKAKAAAERALALDDSLAEAHASLAWVAFTYEWDFVRAEAGFRGALELNPGYATAHQWYTDYLCAMGRLEEATSEIGRARQLDPLSLIISNEAAWPLYYGRRYEEAVTRYRETLALDPEFPNAHLELGMVYASLGRYAEAIAEYERFAELSKDETLAAAYLGHAYGRMGQREQALRQLAMIENARARGYVPAVQAALVHLGLGDNERAFASLDGALAERSDFLLYLKVEPFLDPLRRDPRFARLTQRVGLP